MVASGNAILTAADIGMALLQHAFYGRADKVFVIVGQNNAINDHVGNRALP